MQPYDSIEVREYGDSGPFVVLLHGGPGAPGEMAPVARYLSSSFRVLEPLQRLSGDVPLTVALHVEDLYNVLSEIPHNEHLYLVGFSWGAMLALTYAARYPEQVNRVILIGCGTFDENSRRVYQNNMAQRIKPDMQKQDDHKRRNELFAELGAIYSHIQSFKLCDDCVDDVLYFDEEGIRQTWADAISLQQQNIQPAEFADIRATVTMIHGDEDPHPGRLIYRSLVLFIYNLQYHKPWIEQYARDDFYKLLIDCLK